ncbi:MAG: metallophosphoesterase [Actinomycetota bacterium]|nr:metallophosphoesterase [Actinomycetota bacterium]
MPIHIVSDLHGASDALRKAVPEGSTLVLLGDLINFLDYTSMTGILTEVFAVDTVAQVVRLRTQGRAVEAREIMKRRSEGREEEIRRALTKRMTAQYEEVFSALVDPTYLILGNVDSPETAHAFAQRFPAVTEADGRVYALDGERFGFVGGALPSPLHVAGEITHEQMRAKLDGLGEVDVLCSHIPPAIPELCYDTRAGKLERGSEDLLGYIVDVQPRRAYFGHVHQPLTSMLHIGGTLCVNTGYFRATKRSWPHQGGPAT